MSSDLAFSIALLAGWLALVVWLMMPGSHWCHDEHCDRYQKEKKLGKYKPPPEPPGGWFGENK